VAYQSSFNLISKKWVPEINRHCPGVPFILVATKVDLRYFKKNLKQCKNYKYGRKEIDKKGV
jgi:GTPase SAR1 family protein